MSTPYANVGKIFCVINNSRVQAPQQQDGSGAGGLRGGSLRRLEGRMPDNLKHLLHQAFWHHPQLCKRCKLDFARDDPGFDENGDSREPCPLEHLMTRFKPKVVARKAALVDVKQGPKKIKVWTAFASVEAAAEGYVPLDVPGTMISMLGRLSLA